MILVSLGLGFARRGWVTFALWSRWDPDQDWWGRGFRTEKIMGEGNRTPRGTTGWSESCSVPWLTFRGDLLTNEMQIRDTHTTLLALSTSCSYSTRIHLRSPFAWWLICNCVFHLTVWTIVILNADPVRLFFVVMRVSKAIRFVWYTQDFSPFC